MWVAACETCGWESRKCITEFAAVVLGKGHTQDNPRHTFKLKEVPDGGTAPKRPASGSDR